MLFWLSETGKIWGFQAFWSCSVDYPHYGDPLAEIGHIFSILSWYHKINFKLGVIVKLSNCLSAVQVKGQSHCKHWVTWPDCFATPSNHCDVTAGLVSLNYIDTLDKKMSQNMQWFKGNYKKTLKMYCWHISKNITIIPLDKFASIISTNTTIDIFDTMLCIYVHFQHCF